MKQQIKPSEIERKWYVVDANGKVLGRIATNVATVLQGKDKVVYSPNWDMGDYVIVVNAAKVKVTGNKEKDKKYYRHSGYPGGIYSKSLHELRETNPEEIILKAVRGMLPKNRLAKDMLKKLYVYGGSEHPHVAQKPVALEIK